MQIPGPSDPESQLLLLLLLLPPVSVPQLRPPVDVFCRNSGILGQLEIEKANPAEKHVLISVI